MKTETIVILAALAYIVYNAMQHATNTNPVGICPGGQPLVQAQDGTWHCPPTA